MVAGLVGLLFASCGYTVERHAGPQDAAAPRLAIVTLDNDSTEPGLERLVSEALRRETLRRGRYRLVEDPASADFVLRGRVLPVERTTQTLSSVVLALEQTVTLALELELEQRGQGAPGASDESGSRVPLPRTTLRESEMFLASADVEAARKNRSEALRRVAGLLAERTHDALFAAQAAPAVGATP